MRGRLHTGYSREATGGNKLRNEPIADAKEYLELTKTAVGCMIPKAK